MLVVAGSAFAQQAAPESNDLEVGAKFAYESHYVNRGIDQSDDNLQTTIDIGYSFANSGDWGFRAYGQVFYMSPISDGGNEADWTLASRAVYADEYFFDFGYRFKSYPNGRDWAREMKRAYVNRSNEIFLGIGRDVELVDGNEWSRVILAGTVSYDWNLDQTSWEVSLEKTFDEVLTPEMSLTLGATYGYITASDWVGDQVGGLGAPDNDYGYFTVKADLVYNLNETTDLGIGFRYTCNNDDARSIHGVEVMDIDRNTFWWGASLTFRY